MTGESTSFTIGTEERTSDGACSELTRVVIDPFACTLIRLVLAPGELLVPVGLVDRVDGGRAGGGHPVQPWRLCCLPYQQEPGVRSTQGVDLRVSVDRRAVVPG